MVMTNDNAEFMRLALNATRELEGDQTLESIGVQVSPVTKGA